MISWFGITVDWTTASGFCVHSQWLENSPVPLVIYHHCSDISYTMQISYSFSKTWAKAAVASTGNIPGTEKPNISFLEFEIHMCLPDQVFVEHLTHLCSQNIIINKITDNLLPSGCLTIIDEQDGPAFKPTSKLGWGCQAIWYSFAAALSPVVCFQAVCFPIPSPQMFLIG